MLNTDAGAPTLTRLSDFPVAPFRVSSANKKTQNPQHRDNKPEGDQLIMKIVVIGGTGLIGSKLVTKLNEHDHQAIAAAPNTGVNTLTGEGLAEALAGASVVVDVSNSPSFEAEAVMKFFETSTRNLLAAEAAADVKHHVALSVVGTDRLPDSGYFLAKLAQEKLIKESSIPYSIVHATQFFEFLKGIADSATVDNKVHLAPVLVQPMAADDVAKAVGRVAVGSPLNGIVDIAGPEQFRLDQFIAQGLSARNDPREVVADPEGRYFGARLSERTLVPAGEAQIGETYFKDWLAQQQSPTRNLKLPKRQRSRFIVCSTSKERGHEYYHYKRWHADLLQRLGHRTADRLQSRLAAFGRCLRGPDVLPGLEWLSLHRA